MVKLVEINKQLYCVGLTWMLRKGQKEKFIKQTLINLHENEQQTKQVKQEKCDAYIIRQEQFGFLDTNKDERFLKSSPLASSLKIVDNSFIGIFHLQDISHEKFWLLVAIDDGIVVGFGDSIFSSKQEAEENITSLLDLFSAEQKIKRITCDEIEESIAFLSPRLPTLKRFFPKNRLKALYKKKGNNTKIFVMFLLVMGISAGYFALNIYLENKKKEGILQAELLFLQNKEAQKQRLLENINSIFDKDWQGKYLPLDTYLICQAPLMLLPLSQYGWSLENARCNNASMLTTWKHRTQADYIQLPFNGKLTQNKEVQASHTLAKYEPITSVLVEPHMLLDKDFITQNLYQITQNMGASLKLSFEKVDVKEYKDLQLTLTCPWQKGKFAWEKVPSSLLLNDSLFQFLGQFPSLYLTSIEFSNNVWIIKGEFYVQS